MDHRVHPDDERLLEHYFTARWSETPDPRIAEHLAECSACAARHGELTAFMTGVRKEAEADVDALFAPARMAAQREQILQRLSHVHRTARVLAFPATLPAASGAGSVRIPSRWLAGAAAAGLFIGVALGGFVGSGTLRRAGDPVQQTLSAPVPAVSALAPAAELPDDDAFLMELETALTNHQLRELQPFDALTPQVREIATVVR